ncbi:hypothetical protein D3C76_225980 [compost metagenome]
MRVNIDFAARIEHNLWTQEIQDNFESLIVMADILDYRLDYRWSYTKSIDLRSSLRLSFIGENKRIYFYFRLYRNEILEIRITSTNDAGKVFEPDLFDIAIEFVKSLL